MIYLVAVVIALVVGCLFGIQPSVNGFLGTLLSHPLQASLISFASGTVCIFFVCLASGNFPLRFSTPPSQIPLWAWLGGAIGVVIVTSSLIFVPKIGSLLWFAAVITGQIVTAIVLDHFGWLGNPRVTASPMRLLGAGLLLAGLMIIIGAKWKDSRTATSQNAAVLAKGSKGID